ncbi:MAG: hypothetical protein LWW75_04535 [Chlorobiales bacterium]|nr:hypothetical protein [Chlorobiales bacterium]
MREQFVNVLPLDIENVGEKSRCKNLIGLEYRAIRINDEDRFREIFEQRELFVFKYHKCAGKGYEQSRKTLLRLFSGLEGRIIKKSLL